MWYIYIKLKNIVDSFNLVIWLACIYWDLRAAKIGQHTPAMKKVILWSMCINLVLGKSEWYKGMPFCVLSCHAHLDWSGVIFHRNSCYLKNIGKEKGTRRNNLFCWVAERRADIGKVEQTALQCQRVALTFISGLYFHCIWFFMPNAFNGRACFIFSLNPKHVFFIGAWHEFIELVLTLSSLIMLSCPKLCSVSRRCLNFCRRANRSSIPKGCIDLCYRSLLSLYLVFHAKCILRLSLFWL